jgi:cytidylate kinase
MAATLDHLVVAVDGPSGAGKSSTARGVARRLGLRYLDTGAMYRAVTAWMLAAGIDVDEPAAVAARVGEPRLDVGTDPDAPSIALDGVGAEEVIRTPEVTAAVSAVAAVPEVRARLVAMQRDQIGAGGIVVEGRDIGTTVAPDAAVKVFLTADPEARAQRRAAELDPAAAAKIATVADLERRDRHDAERATSPLTRADDAVVIDSSHRTLDEVIEAVVGLVNEATAGPR